MRIFWVVVVVVSGSIWSAKGQTGNVNIAVKKDSVITDIFLGNIHMKKPDCDFSKLELSHCRYCDEGTFTLTGKRRYSPGCGSLGFDGEWTVLRGDAADKNATVVELDITGKTLYFLRLKNGDLQQLDSTLQAIPPAVKHTWHKEKKQYH